MERAEDAAVDACTRCADLVESRSRIVNGVGPLDADIVLVGEAPGVEEDARGEPFVGRSGEILDTGLEERGLDREAVRITNCVRCRPPENRDPRTEELENCRRYLERELRLVDPKVVVTLGKVASEHLLGRSVAVTGEAGSVDRLELEGETYPVLISVHPAATLYDRSQRDTLESVLDRAVSMAVDAGLDGQEGQAELGDF
ncbi:MAG: uracil-DNA glycosylase family protein [Halodesulfurarchaeum sp.]